MNKGLNGAVAAATAAALAVGGVAVAAPQPAQADPLNDCIHFVGNVNSALKDALKTAAMQADLFPIFANGDIHASGVRTADGGIWMYGDSKHNVYGANPAQRLLSKITGHKASKSDIAMTSSVTGNTVYIKKAQRRVLLMSKYTSNTNDITGINVKTSNSKVKLGDKASTSELSKYGYRNNTHARTITAAKKGTCTVTFSYKSSGKTHKDKVKFIVY